ncbi:hypothetical protein B0H63DRAFT_33103 [Podospora didyma]|uniref:Ankyrin repeat protein n=1 Tax=Podospora didyma TaxID=330526 RepID=A0AAE0P686_9PEZI|nr:hypothetical protein B0H63DRAFT_33103 [Podospora didyma]
MRKVKDGRVTKPGGSTSSNAQPSRRKRGRPAIEWTRSRKRKLLRLYLYTPEADLSLKKILDLLAEGGFHPKLRHTQCLLKELLSRLYRQKRPRNWASMEDRLAAYLRSLRDTKTSASLSPTVLTDCSILLASNPSANWRPSNWDRAGLSEQMRELDSPSPTSLPKSDEDGDIDLSPRSPRDFGESSRQPGCVSVDNTCSGGTFKYDSGTTDERRDSCMNSLRDRFPSQTSSFLADVASLLSGLSIYSSSAESSSHNSASTSSSRRRRRRRRSSASTGALQGNAPSSSVSESARSNSRTLSEDPRRLKAESQTPAISHVTRAENEELVCSCCSKTVWCLHQRINAAVIHKQPADSFACTPEEVNTRDGLGNTALHVAARWGAPGPILFRLMALSSNPAVINQRHETFLHVLDPSSLSNKELGHIAKYLATSRVFNFAQLDEEGHTFVERLFRHLSFSIESLEAIF